MDVRYNHEFQLINLSLDEINRDNKALLDGVKRLQDLYKKEYLIE